MTKLETLLKMYEHVWWANKRILESLTDDDEQQRARRLFFHVLHAEKVWLFRLRGEDSSGVPIWGEAGKFQCGELVKDNETMVREYFSSLKTSDLEREISYKNSREVMFVNTVREILTHVALHGQYHRGQINMCLRDAAFEPVNVDFITFVRYE